MANSGRVGEMIGVFDSGFGGLWILREVLKILPQYDYLYLGDTARTPYGNRSREVVTRFTKQAVDFLFQKGARVILIACNTATGFSLREIQEEYLRKPGVMDKKILGVTRPVAEEAIRVSAGGKIGVCGTRGTISSKTFDLELQHIDPGVSVVSQACPLLVPLIEEGWDGKPETNMILRKYLRPLKHAHVDTLVLGCTHYGLIYKTFQRMMGRRCVVLESGKIVAKSFSDYLKRHPEIETLLSRGGKRTFFTTDDPERFSDIGSRFFGAPFVSERAILE